MERGHSGCRNICRSAWENLRLCYYKRVRVSVPAQKALPYLLSAHCKFVSAQPQSGNVLGRSVNSRPLKLFLKMTNRLSEKITWILTSCLKLRHFTFTVIKLSYLHCQLKAYFVTCYFCNLKKITIKKCIPFFSHRKY